MMRLKFLMLPLIAFLGFTQLFSNSYVHLTEKDLAVQAGPQGSPTLQVEGNMYFIRDWEPDAGCYRLTQVRLIGYNFAALVDEEYCSRLPTQ